MTIETPAQPTGKGLVFGVQQALSLSGVGSISAQEDLGCIDAPRWIAAGSHICTESKLFPSAVTTFSRY